jgi:hypothetical protein
MVNLIIWSFGYLVIWSFGSTLRAEVSARSACGSREDCAELDSFPQKMRDFMCVNDAPSLDDFEPKRALVRFFDDNTESGDEFGARPSVA